MEGPHESTYSAYAHEWNPCCMDRTGSLQPTTNSNNLQFSAVGPVSDPPVEEKRAQSPACMLILLNFTTSGRQQQSGCWMWTAHYLPKKRDRA